MSLPKNCNHTDRSKQCSLYNLKLSNYGLKRAEIVDKFGDFRKFMELWHMTTHEFNVICDELFIRDKDLFEFSTFAHGDCILVGKDVLYTEKEVREYGTYKCVKTYHDLCIRVNEFSSLRLNEIARVHMKRKFPQLFTNPFVVVKPRFDDEIKELEFPIDAPFDHVDQHICAQNNMTIGDFINLVMIPSYKDITTEIPLITIYGDGHIFLSLSEDKTDGHSLYLKPSDFFDKNWKAVEERNVYSIPIDKAEAKQKKWYDGPQKGAPYFKHELVEEIKRILF